MPAAMPMLDQPLAGTDWPDPDGLPPPVVTVGFVIADVAALELAPHAHRRGQLMFVQRGALSCEIEGGLWIVPPGSAVWIPGDVTHGVKAAGMLEGYNVFVDPDVGAGLSERCCALAVTPLLRELLIRSAQFPALREGGGVRNRLFSVLLDELASARAEDLYLPMPADPRLRRMAASMLREPTARGTIASWAARCGMSERTLCRTMSRQTGMSIGRWRRRLGIVRTIERLAAGASIQQVAEELGYDSVPSFTTMFTRELGVSPRRYMSERHSG